MNSLHQHLEARERKRWEASKPKRVFDPLNDPDFEREMEFDHQMFKLNDLAWYGLPRRMRCLKGPRSYMPPLPPVFVSACEPRQPFGLGAAESFGTFPVERTFSTLEDFCE